MITHNFNQTFSEIFEGIKLYITNTGNISKLKIKFQYIIIPNSNNNYSDPDNNYIRFIQLLNNKLKSCTELELSNNLNNQSNNRISNSNNQSNNRISNSNNQLNNRISNSNNRSNDKIMIVSHNHTISNKFCKSRFFDENLENTSISKMFYNPHTNKFTNTKSSNKKIGKCRIVYHPEQKLSPKKVFSSINNNYIQVYNQV